MAAIAIEDMTPRAALLFLSAQIEKLDAYTLGQQLDHLSKEIHDLKDYVELMDIKYDGLLKTVLIEFDNHRQGISLILKGLGYEVDPIRGWDVNTWKEETNGNSRKSKRILRRRRKKEKRGTKHESC